MSKNAIDRQYTDRAGAAVVSTITSIRIIEVVWDWIRDSYTETLLNIEGVTEVI